MTWPITANIVTLFLVDFISLSVHQPVYNLNPNYSGTCASVGYSTKCCPPGETCQASDGKCKCGTDCHLEHLDDCCGDVFCHPSNNYDINLLLYAMYFRVCK